MSKIPGYTQQASNRIRGKFFEEALQTHARLRGFFIRKTELTAKFIAKNRSLIQKSELDFQIIRRDGRVGYFDCKTYDKDFFYFSDISESQLKRSCDYLIWNVPSGFITWFRTVNQVAFFRADFLRRTGPGTRFTASMGIPLGKIEGIDLAPIFTLQGPTVPQQPVDRASSQEQCPTQGRLLP